MANIFISYRRADSRDSAGRIYDRLKSQFGESAVFMDVEDIPKGLDFREQLQDRLQECQAVLAIIGDKWNQDEIGPSEFVRIEIATALARDNLPVIPVIVEPASMPLPEQLPEDIRNLAYRNAVTFYSDQSFEIHIQELIEEISTHTGMVALDKTERELSKLSNLPASRNPLFIGRDAFLENMSRDAQNSMHATCVHVAFGLGGIGKSQLALEYSFRYRENYNLVWWVRSETEQGQLQDLAELAQALNLPQAEHQDLADSAQAAVRWLNNNSG